MEADGAMWSDDLERIGGRFGDREGWFLVATGWRSALAPE